MDIATIIGQYAFPIVACIAMAYYVKYQTDANRQDLKETRQEHEDEVDKLTRAINNNTVVIQQLLAVLGNGGK